MPYFTASAHDDHHRFRSPGWAVWSVLLCLFCLPVLYAQSPPAAPSDLTATTAGSSQIDLEWTDNSGDEEGFIIQRSITSGSGFVDVDTVGADSSIFSDVSLNEYTTYYYKVAAYNANGRSDSNEANAATSLAAPSGLSATTMSNTRIDLEWTDNSGLEDGFKIELKNGPGGSYVQVATVGASVTSYMSTGLDPNTTYYFRVRAYKSSDNSAYSNEDSATTYPNPPAAPSSLTATAVSNSQINLSWSDHSNNETGFKIERKLTSGINFTQIDTVAAGVTSYASTGLTATTSYTYRVRAYNAGGPSAFSNQASDTTLIDPPVAPSGLTATAVSNSQIDLSWVDNALTEDGFLIERKTGAGGSYAQIASVGANVTSYASTGLSGSTEYFYRVRAYNVGGNSNYSNEDEATTLQDPPAAPGNLRATALNNEQIDLAWTDLSNNETGFKVEIKAGAGGAYTELATNSANDTTYTSTGLEADTEYFYRVRAFNSTGSSPYSNEDSATTLPEPPAAPSNLNATTVSNTQIDLAWNDNSNNEDGFKIERKLSTAATFSEITTVGANVTSYASTGLLADTSYTYRVRAYNAVGNSAYTGEVSATTLPNPPAAPSSLIATTVSNTQIDLAWTDNSGSEIGFRIERKAAGEGSFTEIATTGVGTTNYASTGLSGNTEYFYRVRAYNAGGNSSYSNEANATTQPDPLVAPSNLMANTVSSSQIDLTWNDNSSNEDGFKIERRVPSTPGFITIVTLPANQTSFANTGLTGNTIYIYRVRAFNAFEHSGYSNTARDTTLLGAPAAPSNLIATAATNNLVNLTWTDNAGNEAGFKIERKRDTDTSYTQIASIGPNLTNYASSGLNGNVIYYYRLRAFNGGGHSAYSNVDSALTLLKAPSNLLATAINSNQIDIVWTDGIANETGFKVERKTGVAGSYAVIATLGANVTSYSNTGLAANAQYFYRVRAFNATNTSAFSNEDDATTLNVPLAPDSLCATAVSNTQINLSWLDKSTGEDGFKIERKTGAAGTFTQIATVGANVTSYSNTTGLGANTSYFYRVRSFNTGGNSSYSNEASAKTLIKGPSNLAATPSGGSQIDLSWIDQTSNETGFKLERKTGAGGSYAEIATVGANATNYSNTGLAANTQYFYRVRAFNATNISAYSNEDDATTFNVPVPPDSLTALAVSNTQINLSWLDPSSDEDGFKIERKTGAAGTFTQIAMVGANVTSYSNTTGLGANTLYVYRVRTHSAGGNSSYSDEGSAKTLIKGPSNLEATAISGSQIDLTWVDQASSESGFKIERKTGAGGSYAEIATVGANATNYSNTGLATGTQYFYRVRAFTATNVSAYTNEDEATTFGPAKASDPDSSATQSLAALPEGIILVGNYPYPFNPASTLEYSLSEGTHVKLTVLDVNGRVVAVLANGYQSAGIHHKTFKAAALPSGVYYAVLKAGAVTRVQRMLLAK